MPTISGESLRLILHTPDSDSELSSYYRSAFANATELFIVTAYLTEWDSSLVLNSACRNFRIIIGKDFGITKKAACEAVMKWLPSKRKGQFMVADSIAGFHPKAVFWKETNGHAFAIIGSSNLTRAAFETNFEANLYCPLSAADYLLGKQWVKRIEKQSVVVSEDWLQKYPDAPTSGGRRPKGSKNHEPDIASLITFKLPKPQGMKEAIKERREQLLVYKKKQAGLKSLFKRCASEKISSRKFYDELPKYLSNEVGNSLQSGMWKLKGKRANFTLLSQSFLKILDASDEDRDDVVAEEIDMLKEHGVPARKAFLSEMLCLSFPKEYPLWNKPVHDYLKAIKFKAPRGASEGVYFIDLAKKLRASLLQNPEHPAKNLAELDGVIFLKYG